MPLDPARTVAELRELRELTGDENGAQRVAWTGTWETARELLRQKMAPTGAVEEIDEAGNQWFTLPGASESILKNEVGRLANATHLGPIAAVKGNSLRSSLAREATNGADARSSSGKAVADGGRRRSGATTLIFWLLLLLVLVYARLLAPGVAAFRQLGADVSATATVMTATLKTCLRAEDGTTIARST